MKTFPIFVAGLVVGGVLSAACGFDLFHTSDTALLQEARKESRALEDQVTRLKNDLALGALEFFSRPRPLGDCGLARSFLLGEGDSWYKRELVVRLRRHNPEFLLSLNGPPPLPPSDELPGQGEIPGAAIVPAVSRIDEGGGK